ncbi:3'-5' exoribonuclease [Pseudoxanthomonas mexicana]|uniref:3'-5' exoribonuclease n=1 Tax=Pseudoxanthomonas mexicana TaxID=128785 RepID=UPI0022F404DE|nr:3'-5' exoribonuclease [Pseudoxanthomonas mexicana]WBX94948.1 3'-5' exoribonuclease [Pseudoxanthomonas mexicana]
MTYLFLDTEWADPTGSELVSLALISEDGVHRFYAERDPLPEKATDFVRSVVYPLLDRGKWRMSDQAMTTGLRAFLGAVTDPIVIADYANDLALLRYVIAGLDLSDDQAAACGPVPQPVMTRMLKEGAMGMLIEDYFAGHPDAAARRHHALIDAEALRMAWLVVTGRVSTPPWATTMFRHRAQP